MAKQFKIGNPAIRFWNKAAKPDMNLVQRIKAKNDKMTQVRSVRGAKAEPIKVPAAPTVRSLSAGVPK